MCEDSVAELAVAQAKIEELERQLGSVTAERDELRKPLWRSWARLLAGKICALEETAPRCIRCGGIATHGMPYPTRCLKHKRKADRICRHAEHLQLLEAMVGWVLCLDACDGDEVRALVLFQERQRQ